MNVDVEKAVKRLDSTALSLHKDWNTITQALRDQEAEIAAMREKADKFMWQVRDTCTRAEKAEALLRECDAVARKRGDKYGLCDAIDNDGQPYQSAHLAAHLGGDHG